jgi:hypothetical protein
MKIFLRTLWIMFEIKKCVFVCVCVYVYLYMCTCLHMCICVWSGAVEGIHSLLQYSQKATSPDQSCQEAVSIHHCQVYLNIAIPTFIFQNLHCCGKEKIIFFWE